MLDNYVFFVLLAILNTLNTLWLGAKLDKIIKDLPDAQ